MFDQSKAPGNQRPDLKINSSFFKSDDKYEQMRLNANRGNKFHLSWSSEVFMWPNYFQFYYDHFSCMLIFIIACSLDLWHMILLKIKNTCISLFLYEFFLLLYYSPIWSYVISAISKRPMGEPRVPTDLWSGFGFSNSVPDYLLQSKLSQFGLGSHLPNITSLAEVWIFLFRKINLSHSSVIFHLILKQLVFILFN